MKIFIKILSCIVTVGFVFYSYSHYIREKDLKQLKEGKVKRNEVIMILKQPVDIQKVELPNKKVNFYRYQNRKNDLNAIKSNKSYSVTKETYQGHKCMLFCPNLFEDQFVVYYNDEGIACKIERIGL